MQAEVPGGAPGGPGPPGGQQVVTPGLLLAELQCPICVEVIADPFVTPCGHTFCYQCITTHLRHQSNCPSCRSYLVQEQVHPNFLLDKILARAAGTAPVPGGATPGGSLQRLLQQALSESGQLRGSDIDGAIQVLQAARRQLSNQENSSNLQLLLLFLQQARSHKAASLGELDAQLGVLAADIRTAVLGHISDPTHLATWAAAAAAAAAAGAAGGGPGVPGVRPGEPAPAALPGSLPAQEAAAAAAVGGGDAWGGSRASGGVRPAAGGSSGPGSGAAGEAGGGPADAGAALEAAATAAAAPAMQQLAALRQLLLQQQALAAARGPGAPLGPPPVPAPPGSGGLAEGQPRPLPRVNSFPHLLTLPMGATEEALAAAAPPGGTTSTGVTALLQQQQQQQQAAGLGGGAGPSSAPGPGPGSSWRGGGPGPTRWAPRPTGTLPLGAGGLGEGHTELAAHLRHQQQQQQAAGVLEGPAPGAGITGAGAAVGPRLSSGGAPLLAAPGRPGAAPPTFRPGPRLGPGLGSSSGGFQPYLAASPPPPPAAAAGQGGGLVGSVPRPLGAGGVPLGDGGWGLLPGSPGSPRGGGDDAGDCCSVAPPVSRREERGAAAGGGAEGAAPAADLGAGVAAMEADPPAAALAGGPPGRPQRSSVAEEEDTAGGLAAAAGVTPLGGEGAGTSGAALAASRKRKILAQYPALAEAYLASRLQVGGAAAATAAAAVAAAAAAGAAGMAGATPEVQGVQGPTAAEGVDDPPAAAADAATLAAAQDAAAPGEGLGASGAPRVTPAAAPDVGEGQAEGGGQGSGPDGAPLAAFSHVLSSVTRYSRLQLLGCVPPPTQAGASSASILTAADWDCGGSLAAVAGAAGRISCYTYQDLTAGASNGSRAGGGDAPLPPGPAPVLELPSRSKLSCLSFSPSVAGALLAGDGEGGVAAWDCAAGRCTGRWEAHSRRLHALHHSAPHPGRWASGSDDGTVKVWDGGGGAPSLTMAVGVPVCSVRYHPTTPHLLAVGSAKHAVLLYDLRAPATPLAALAGHAKAVSYVRWQEGASSNSLAAAEVKEEGGPQPMEVQGSAEGATGVHGSSSNGGGSAGSSSTALVSASVDSTLRRWVWDPAAASAAGGGGSSLAAAVSSAGAGWRCERLFSGHTTTKAFTGLSVEGPYIATGSETNEVYLYHAAMSGPAATTRLPLPGGGAGAGLGSTGDVFVSAVAWRRGGRVLLATNSAGGVYVLGLSG